MATIDKRTHVFRHQRASTSEQAALRHVGVVGARLLDVGTGATGRSALVAADLGADVISIEMSVDAIREFAATAASEPISLAGADLAALPFLRDTFDVVLVAFHGMDYATDSAARRRTLTEIERVLLPGGTAIIDSYNPVGLMLRRRMWQVPHLRKRMVRYVATGEFARSTFVDMTGLELHQAVPIAVVREVERVTGLRHDATFDAEGNAVGLSRATLRSAEPYFVFRKDS